MSQATTEAHGHVHEAVAPSAFTSADYDWDDQTLTLEFRDGSVYRYELVPPRVYHRLMASRSPGHFYNEEIKGRYDSRCLRHAPHTDRMSAIQERTGRLF